jgi:hypothetical protein
MSLELGSSLPTGPKTKPVVGGDIDKDNQQVLIYNTS